MTERTGTFWRIAKTGQRRWDRFKLEVKDRVTGFEPLVLMAYRGHAAAGGTIRITARLIEEKGVEQTGEEAGVVENIANTIRRFESDEIPEARIVARHGSESVEGETDHEGFIELTLDAGELEPGWTEVELELLQSMAGGEGLTAEARVVVPSPDADFAVLSDIDDTVLETRATDLVTELQLVFAKSPEQRSPMPGAAPLYRMLESGPDREGWNPFFYVSNSGWGLYDLIETFLDHHELPLGPLYLQDIAIIEPKSPEVGAEDHKQATIRTLLDDYPDLPFVLIGDSGQHDPETYRDIVRDYSRDRIRAVLIRAVTPPERDAEVRTIVQEIADMGVAAAAAESSVSLARAAADFGLIPGDAIPEIREAMVKGQQAV
jgi:phosphatidate phosphatase APP1